MLKNLFFDLFLFLIFFLFCMLLRKDPRELVLMMERNLSCSMKILHVFCESWFYKGIARKIYGEGKDEDGRNIFDVG